MSYEHFDHQQPPTTIIGPNVICQLRKTYQKKLRRLRKKDHSLDDTLSEAEKNLHFVQRACQTYACHHEMGVATEFSLIEPSVSVTLTGRFFMLFQEEKDLMEKILDYTEHIFIIPVRGGLKIDIRVKYFPTDTHHPSQEICQLLETAYRKDHDGLHL